MRLLHALLATALVASPAAAQIPDSVQARRDSLPPAPFFTVKDAYVAAAFAGAAVLATQFDSHFAEALQTERANESQFVAKTASFFRFMGQPTPQIIGGSLFVGGRLLNKPVITDLGLHGLEGIFMSNAITGIVKRVAGRARPYVHKDSVSTDFKLMRGFKNGRDFQSFPSGHATTAFAAAAGVTAESENFWPGHQMIVGTVLFGGASLVGVSRMYHDDHWASDVIVGALIGTFSGFKVVKYNHEHPDSRVNRFLLGIDVTPAASGGVSLSQTIRF